jgi:hypothetical protein
MPNTYTYQNLVDLARSFIKNAPITTIDSQCADAVSNIMYRYYPWRFTLKTIASPIALVDGQQDYDASGITDLFRIVRMRIARTDTTPNEYNALIVKKWIEPELTAKLAFPNFRNICVVDETSFLFRLDAAASISSGVTLEIQGGYQVTPTKIGDVQLAGTCWFPDHYKEVFEEGIKWKFYQYMDDKRAGTVVITKDGRAQYSGQLGVFMDQLWGMAAAEDAGEGDEVWVPDEALVDGGGGAPTVFGY